ncbi:hypothetical protein B9T62_25490 [Paenibacillus donghaensis]|uniref:RNA polymerase subunit sigma-24 n=1 Tax=Paenibacillus donghaensis TaxID=414771 RepID=A0A2Z2KVE6_9BACL|nr:hypothetical protein B9T62_25490 [Paenibacillus donghaensis]
MADDNELMARVQTGDKQAYEELVLRYRMKAIAFAASFVRDLYTAEDIVQECFVKVYLRRASYRPDYSFHTYLFTVIRNQCIDYLRASKTRHKMDAELADELSDGHTPEEILANRENTKQIYEALNQLEGDYKTALYLFAIADFSYKEIASTMSKTVPQIKILLYRARKKFKNQYKGVEIN